MNIGGPSRHVTILTARGGPEFECKLLTGKPDQREGSMEEEARRILRESLDQKLPETIADIARELFGPKHGFDLPPHPRVTPRPPPDFSDE